MPDYAGAGSMGPTKSERIDLSADRGYTETCRYPEVSDLSIVEAGPELPKMLASKRNTCRLIAREASLPN